MKPDEIKAIRKALDLNTADFGKRLGVSGRTVEDWEQGRHKPGGSAILLMQVLGANSGGGVAEKSEGI